MRLMAILAHPDDESLGMGGVLVKYAREGVETYLLTATRGEVGWPGPPAGNPGPTALGALREGELRAAAAELGIRQVEFLDVIDGQLDRADTQQALARLTAFIRRVRPQVVVTFGPDGDYGHPDHIAISQLTSGALVCAADPACQNQSGPIHRVDKFYYLVNSPQLADALRKYVGEPGIEVGGVQRGMVTWPDWAITTRSASTRMATSRPSAGPSFATGLSFPAWAISNTCRMKPGGKSSWPKMPFTAFTAWWRLRPPGKRQTSLEVTDDQSV